MAEKEIENPQIKSFFDELRQNIKYYRDQKGWSQAELAIQSDSPKGTIGSIEAGSSHPSFNNIIKIATALGVHPADLFLRNCSKSHIKLKKELEETLLTDIKKVIERQF